MRHYIFVSQTKSAMCIHHIHFWHLIGIHAFSSMMRWRARTEVPAVIEGNVNIKLGVRTRKATAEGLSELHISHLDLEASLLYVQLAHDHILMADFVSPTTSENAMLEHLSRSEAETLATKLKEYSRNAENERKIEKRH